MFADGIEENIAEKAYAAAHGDAFGMDERDDVCECGADAVGYLVQRLYGEGVTFARGLAE